MNPCAIIGRLFLPVLVVLAVLAFAALVVVNVARDNLRSKVRIG